MVALTGSGVMHCVWGLVSGIFKGCMEAARTVNLTVPNLSEKVTARTLNPKNSTAQAPNPLPETLNPNP